MTYALGARSLSFLAQVDTKLVAIVQRAIAITDQDFGFTEPQFRTLAEEEAKVASGASHTLHSHHLPQANGLGGAVDAVPWDGEKFVWEWPRIFVIARAFQAAAADLQTEITWGGVWDRLMSDYADPRAAEADYVARRQAAGQSRVFVDGPHFELGRN